jgi:uncharacterized protein (DUF433 family)
METPPIISDPAVMMGKPVVAGTRITVEHILEELAGEMSIPQLVASHPRLNVPSVYSALLFAARAFKSTAE